MRSEYPALARVLGAYFHQDWVHDFADDDAVLSEIVAVFEPHELRSCVTEAGEILSADFGDDDLAGVLLFGAGCYFSGAATGLTSRQWLSKIVQRFEAATQRK